MREGWVDVELGEIVSKIQYGFTESSSEKQVGPKFLRITDIQDNRVDWDAVPYCRISSSKLPEYLLEDGDLLFARTGATVGKSFLIRGLIPEAVFASYLIRVRVQKSMIDEVYLSYFFHSLFYWKQITEGQVGIGQPNVNGTTLKRLVVPLAPLPEQRRIVSAIETQLGRLDAAVARLQAAKAKLKRYKQAVLKAAYTGQLFVEDADMSDDAPLPEGWHWGTLGDFVKIRNGYAFKSTDYRDEGALLIRQSNLGGSKVTTEGAKYLPEHYLIEHPGFHVVQGDILIGMSGSIGKLCTYDLDYPALQNQRTGLLQFKDEKQKPWVWSYLPLLEQSLLKQGKGVAVLNVSAKQIESSPVPVAPIEVQQRIIDEVEQRMSTIDETEATLDAQLLQSTRLRQAVLKRAFEGRLV